MKVFLLSLIFLVLGAPAWAQGNSERRMELNLPDPPMLGKHFARGGNPNGSPFKSPNMTYHGGPILPSTAAEAIFWGRQWSNSTFVGDKITGLATFYSGVGGSNYAKTNTEYTDSGAHIVSPNVSNSSPAIIDTSTAPSNAPSTSVVLSEVCSALANNGVTPQSNGYYPVYVDTPRANAGYCAWHSWGSCGGIPVQFAFFFNLDGDPGCDPQDTSGQHSQGLAALANVSGHELSEAMTDPRGNAWYDNSGYENSDKCAWTFGNPLVTFTGGSRWKIQGNWSNAAYNGNSGYPSSKGQLGCIDGGP